MTPEEVAAANRAVARMSEAWMRLLEAAEELDAAHLPHTSRQVDDVRRQLSYVRTRIIEGLDNV